MIGGDTLNIPNPIPPNVTIKNKRDWLAIAGFLTQNEALQFAGDLEAPRFNKMEKQKKDPIAQKVTDINNAVQQLVQESLNIPNTKVTNVNLNPTPQQQAYPQVQKIETPREVSTFDPDQLEPVSENLQPNEVPLSAKPGEYLQPNEVPLPVLEPIVIPDMPTKPGEHTEVPIVKSRDVVLEEEPVPTHVQTEPVQVKTLSEALDPVVQEKIVRKKNKTRKIKTFTGGGDTPYDYLSKVKELRVHYGSSYDKHTSLPNTNPYAGLALYETKV